MPEPLNMLAAAGMADPRAFCFTAARFGFAPPLSIPSIVSRAAAVPGAPPAAMLRMPFCAPVASPKPATRSPSWGDAAKSPAL